MKLKKYSEIFKINEDVKDDDIPFKKLNSSKKDDVSKLREENARKNTGLSPEKENELERLRKQAREDAEYYAKKHDGILDEKDILKVDGSEEYEPSDDEISLAGKSLDDLDGEEEVEEDTTPKITSKVDKTKVKESGEAYTESDLDADMKSLTSLISDLFKNTSISAEVIYDGLDIDIYVFLHRREKMKEMLKVFDAVIRLKRDILPQYQSTVELYESKETWPILQFRFEYESEVAPAATKKEEMKALPPAQQIKQGNLFVDDPTDLATRTDSDSKLPF